MKILIFWNLRNLSYAGSEFLRPLNDTLIDFYLKEWINLLSNLKEAELGKGQIAKK